MRQAKGVDLLVHEAMDPWMLGDLNRAAAAAGEDIAARVAHDILTYHTFPEEAARIARTADAGELVLTHIIPPLPVSVLQSAFLGDSARIYDGPITVAFEGMLFSLPPNTTQTKRRWLLR
jgi:ribonuclease Z